MPPAPPPHARHWFPFFRQKYGSGMRPARGQFTASRLLHAIAWFAATAALIAWRLAQHGQQRIRVCCSGHNACHWNRGLFGRAIWLLVFAPVMLVGAMFVLMLIAQWGS